MIAKGRSMLRAYIEDTGEYLSHLLSMYPKLLDEWMQDKEKECRNVAKDSSEGDVEVETSIYHSLFQGYESFGETDVLFYDAMFIMVYSYYESVIMKLSKMYCCNNRPSKICEKHKVQLSDEAQKRISFLYNTIRVLRNQFCHNFLGTIGSRKEKDKQIVNKLIQAYPSMICYDDNSIHILKREFISEVLEKERFVLNELIIKLHI